MPKALGRRPECIHVKQIMNANVTANSYVANIATWQAEVNLIQNLRAENTSIFIGKLTRIDCGL